MKPPTGIVKHRRRTTNDERRTTENPLRIGLIGCGRVGTAIALGLKRAGHRIVWVKDIDPKAERKAEHLLGPDMMPKALRLMPDAADVILIATPDAEIVAAYREIADSLSPNQTVVHFSGALTSQNIQHPAPNTQHPNHGVLAMHPVMTFPKCGIRGLTTKTPRHQEKLTEEIGGNRWESVDTVKAACGIPRRTFFSLEGNRKGLATGKRLLRDLGGTAFVLRPEDKPLFHAACVFVSNFLDALIDAGIELCRESGLESKTAYRILEPLIRQTLMNIAESGTTQALSGPIERGDIETVRRHLAALSKRRPELVQLYEALAARTLIIAARKIRSHRFGTQGPGT